MNLKPRLRRIQALERVRNPPNYTFVWKDQNSLYSVNGDLMDDAAYQRWYAQQGSNKIVYILAWR